MFLNRSDRLEHGRQDIARLSMSAPSSLPKPFAGLLVASLDAVAVAIAETNIELSPGHTLSGSSEIPADRHAEQLREELTLARIDRHSSQL